MHSIVMRKAEGEHALASALREFDVSAASPDADASVTRGTGRSNKITATGNVGAGTSGLDACGTRSRTRRILHRAKTCQSLAE